MPGCLVPRAGAWPNTNHLARKPRLLCQSTLVRPAKADGALAWLIAYQEPHMRKGLPSIRIGRDPLLILSYRLAGCGRASLSTGMPKMVRVPGVCGFF